MSEDTETVVPVTTLAQNAGIVARDELGFSALPTQQQKTVDQGVHIARVKIRGGLTTDLVPLAIKKAELLHASVIATLKAFEAGTEPSGEYAEQAAWDKV